MRLGRGVFSIFREGGVWASTGRRLAGGAFRRACASRRRPSARFRTTFYMRDIRFT